MSAVSQESATKPAQFRNIALLDHEGAGETTLVESMLHVAGATRRMGHVREHNTVSDFDPDEVAFEKSFYCSTVSFGYRDLQFNCLDVPGAPDTIGEAMTALAAVESALVCVDCVDGIKVNTRRMWRLAAQRHLPRFIAVTRLDDERAGFTATLDAIKSEFGNRALPLWLPEGEGGDITGLCSVLHDYDRIAGGDELYEQIVEAIIETDDALMERYLEGETISEAVLLSAFSSALLHGNLFPVIPTAAEREIGVVELLELLADLAPGANAIERWLHRDGEAVPLPEVDGFTAYVYRSVSDEYLSRISYARILSGSLPAHGLFVNRRTGNSEKAGHIYRISGREMSDLDRAVAGDLVAIPRVADMHAGDLLTGPDMEFGIDHPEFPMPMVSLAIKPKTHRDEQKIGEALHELEADDRTFHLHTDSRSGDLIVSGMSDLHLERMLGRLKRRYRIEVECSAPQVAYMETITSAVRGVEYTHKKQSGGAGQFGRVVIDLEPLARGEGYQFEDRIHAGVIDAVFRPAVDKGVQAAMAEGVLAGFPATDLKVTLVDGKTHSVDSKEIAFYTAGRMAFKKAFAACNPVLLEPVVRMEVTLPQGYIGDIMGDLNARRGRILSTDIRGESAVIEALVPVAEIQSYQAHLKAMTSGEGTFITSFDHYQEVPPHLQQKIVKAQQNS